MDGITITLPWPPSVNNYFAVMRGRKILSAKGRAFKRDCQAAVLEQIGIPQKRSGRLNVLIVLHPPDKHLRDLDNSIKSVLDGLTTAGVWVDDEQIDRLTIVRSNIEKPGSATVCVSTLTTTERGAGR